LIAGTEWIKGLMALMALAGIGGLCIFGYSWKRCLDGSESEEEGGKKKVVWDWEVKSNGHGNRQASFING
jgi:hypothetical protein